LEHVEFRIVENHPPIASVGAVPRRARLPDGGPRRQFFISGRYRSIGAPIVRAYLAGNQGSAGGCHATEPRAVHESVPQALTVVHVASAVPASAVPASDQRRG